MTRTAAAIAATRRQIGNLDRMIELARAGSPYGETSTDEIMDYHAERAELLDVLVHLSGLLNHTT